MLQDVCAAAGRRAADGVVTTRVALLILLSLVASRAGATTIVYTDRDTFTAAAGETLNFTFDEPTPCVIMPLVPPGQFCLVDYGQVAVRYEAYLSPGQIAPDYLRFSGFNQIPTPVDQPFTAVGFDVVPLDGDARFRIGDATFATSSPAFFGIVSDVPLSSLWIDHFHCPARPTQACSFAVDNMAMGMPPHHVPETLPLWTVALPVWWWFRRAAGETGNPRPARRAAQRRRGATHADEA
jgi:hypothetical protein